MLINTIFLEDSFLIKRQSRGIAHFPTRNNKVLRYEGKYVILLLWGVYGVTVWPFDLTVTLQ